MKRDWVIAVSIFLLSMTAIGVRYEKPVAAATIARYAVAMEDGTSIRSGPGTSYPRLTVVKSRTSLRIVAEVKDTAGRTWYKVDCTALKLKQTVGYVASWVVNVQHVEIPDVIPQTYGTSYLLSVWKPKAGVSTQILKPVNLRVGPSITENRLGPVPIGTTVDLVGYAVNSEKETWCRIKTQDGTSGWVARASLKQSEQIPSAYMAVTVGKRVMSAEATVSVSDVPFGQMHGLDVSLKGKVVSGIATDGIAVFARVLDGTSGIWVDLGSRVTIGGEALGGDICSMTGIEILGSCGWTEVTMHISGDKNGLLVVSRHDPERIEVSLPRLVESAQTVAAGTPTLQVSAVKTWSTSAGFVSKIVLYLAGSGMRVTSAVSRSAVRIRAIVPGSALAKSVFLDGKLLCSCDETLFADDATFIPLAAAADVYGLSLLWDATNRQASFAVGERQYVVKDGVRTLKLAQQSSRWSEEMALAPRLVGGLLYVPVATIAHVFNLNVSGDALRVHLNSS